MDFIPYCPPARYKNNSIPAQTGSPCYSCMAKRHYRQGCCHHSTGRWLGVESHWHLH